MLPIGRLERNEFDHANPRLCISADTTRHNETVSGFLFSQQQLFAALFLHQCMQNKLRQNGDELPGTRCRPGSSFILVRFYGLKPLRSGLAAIP